MRYYSSKIDWVSVEVTLGTLDDINWSELKPFVKKLEKLEERLVKEIEFYKKPEIKYTDTYASQLDAAIDTIRDSVVKKGHQELLQRVDDKAAAGFQNVQELLEYVNGKGHEYQSKHEHLVTNNHVPVQAKSTEKRKASFNEIFGTLSAGNPEVTRYYTIEKNKQLSQIKRDKSLSNEERAKRLAEFEKSDENRKLYEIFVTIFPETYTYPLSQKEVDRLRKEAEEAAQKAREEAMKKVGWQILEAIAMVAVACLPGGPLIVAGYVAGKMAVTALNGNVDPISGEKVDSAGYGMMALDMIPGLGALGGIGKASKVGSVIGKIASSSQKAEKIIATTTKAFSVVSKVGAKALKIYDNPVTQMGIAAYQTKGDPTSILLAGGGFTSSLGNKMRQSQKIANVLAKTPKTVQAVAKTIGKGYDRVTNTMTKIGNKIDDISSKSRQSISNFFGKATTKLGNKIDDISLKARSLEVKFAEVPVLAMAGGGSIGRPVKVPTGVGINEKKLEKLRQMKGGVEKVKPEKISDKLWDTHINSIHKLSQGEIKGGHNFDSIITDLQRKYGLSDDDVSKMLVKSKEIIPPGGIHEIKYKGPQLSPGQTWDDSPLPLKRDGSQELMLKNKNKTKTVFDPAVYDPNAIRAGMDDALSSISDEVRGRQSFKGSAMIKNKSGKEEEMWFEFKRNPEGNISTAYPISKPEE